jgi:hypothetical protein
MKRSKICLVEYKSATAEHRPNKTRNRMNAERERENEDIVV